MILYMNILVIQAFDLNDLIINNDILREVVFEQDDTDINVGIDEENGWSRIEEPPFCASSLECRV